MTTMQASRRTRRLLLEWPLLAAVLLLFGLYLAYQHWNEYQQIDIEQRARLTQQTLVIKKNLVPQIVAANKALESIIHDLPILKTDPGAQVWLNRRLKVFGDMMPGARLFLVVNAQGQVTFSTDERALGINVAKRDYFLLAASQNNPRTLYLTPPFKTFLGTYSMSLVRSLSGPTGEFDGLVLSSLDQNFSKAVLNSVLFTSDSRSSLAHGDGLLFLREPNAPNVIGMNLALPGSMFSRHRDSGQSVSEMTDTSSTTGEMRLTALRTIWPADLQLDKPLVVAVSRDLREVFSLWRNHAQMEAGLFFALVVITTLSQYFYQRRQRITGRAEEQQQLALRQSQAHLEQAQHIAQVGSWELDLQTDTLQWSKEIFRLFEIDATKFSANYASFLNAIHPDDREMVNQAYTASLTTRAPYEIIHRLQMADGRIKWVQERCDSDFDSEGKALRSRGTVQDISEVRSAQIALDQLNAELEQRVAQRTVDLQHATEEAERASAAKSEFLAHMSHELRTPLNAVIGFAQLLVVDCTPPLSPQQLANAQDILDAGQHLHQLVSAVLDLSRIESGRLDLSLEPVALAPLIGECVAQIRPLAAQRSLTLEVEVDESLSVQADALRLKQVLLNLLSNAVKYNRPGGQIRLCYSVSAAQQLRLEVHDTGDGIAAADIAHLFQPFERLGNALNGIDGTGIGLALSQRLVHAMGGRIGVSSVLGTGSCFWVELALP
jgi:PAS domain S-box-containing protein